MSRPPVHPSHYDNVTLGALAYVAWGRLTAAEAGRALHMPRWTVARLARALYGRNPAQARAAYVRKLMRQFDGTARRPLTKAQLRAIADRAAAEREQKRDSASETA